MPGFLPDKKLKLDICKGKAKPEGCQARPVNALMTRTNGQAQGKVATTKG